MTGQKKDTSEEGSTADDSTAAPPDLSVATAPGGSVTTPGATSAVIATAFYEAQAAIAALQAEELTGAVNAATAKADLEQLAAAAAVSAASAPSFTKKYIASLSLSPLPSEFAEAVLALEVSLGMPVWLLVQDGKIHDLCRHIEDMFFKAKHELPQGKPVALLIESPGGSAPSAYRIARLLQRRCGSFTAIIANWAKSAATLLSLGASAIIMDEKAQLGPLDVQIFDVDREGFDSALNETQAFERLHAVGLEALDQTVLLLRMRTGKRVDTILPHALKFISDTMRPLLEKVDVVQYTNRLRTLKEAEEYAVRLLRPNFSAEEAMRIARQFVEKYPNHGFVIDFEEAKGIGLNVKEPTKEQAVQLDRILTDIASMNAFGRVVKV